ncbi:BREX system serine/threonine kinase PglW [Actinomadura craniellae]|uniref:BREX system serine/threonine kinase PglW n=1 Tax=Actinomadura craniellae TaxID=2231787 RepID=UPI0018F14BCC|nr:BREX system serine/threonine kinase PglW [Actinomadura craniellae]
MVSGGTRPKPRPPASARRWFQERTSDYPHEQEALDYIERLVPKNEPYRAWATFSFTARSGRVNECDLFLVTPSGLHLVELKAHPGRVVNNGRTWRFHTPHKQILTIRSSPLHLTDLKSKELKGQLEWAARQLGLTGLVIPRIEPSVFLTDPNLLCELDEVQRTRVFGREPGSGLPTFLDGILLKSPPRNAQPIPARLSQQLPQLLKKIGISQSQRHLRFGDDWQLEPDVLDAGPTWEDRFARKSGIVSEEGRVRIYLVNLQATDEDRASVNRAALREYQVLQGIAHPGIAQAIDLRDHMGGPAILFRHRQSDLRLDSYLDVHGPSLSPETRLDLVRQLAEAVRYAHGRSLYHRALSARSVYVAAHADGSDPILRIVDWQTAARDFDTTTSRSSLGNSPVADDHVEDSAQVYLAPEFDNDFPDPVELDVFGLGAVSYLILTGQPPAVDRATLIDRITADRGLHPFAVAEGLSTDLDDLVFRATQGEVTDRLESAERFLEELDRAALPVEEAAATWAGGDPLAAEPGTVIDGDALGAWTVERVLGTGSTGRAFLVTRPVEDEDGDASRERRVFKIALNEDRAAAQLRKEAQLLDQVGGGAIVRLLAGPRELNDRTVLDLEYAGDRSLRTWLDTEGKLTYHQLNQFGADLFRALDQLAGKGLRHRDIKPENLGVFQRVDRVWELKLFDFSHAAASDRDVRTGTRGYLDPFIGTTRRPAFDDHAERYAAAVTLHEMSTKERPTWGDGQSDPKVIDDPCPKLSADLFEPALRDGLTAFFRRALHREVAERFDTFRMMEEAWREIFRAADATAPPGAHSDETLEEQRESAAEAATLETNLRESGLSPRAVSVADGFNATTVDQLLKVAPHELARARGAGSNVRRELLRRHKQWTAALLSPTEPPPVREDAPATLTRSGFDARLRVDELARLLTPAPGRRGSKTPKVIRLTLGLPVDDAEPFPSWPTGTEIADRLDMTSAGVYQAQGKSYKLWFEAPWLRSVRDDLVAVLAAAGRIMTATELAAAFRVRRGGADGSQEQALAQATTVIRAAILAETWSGADRPADDEPRLEVTRLRGHVLVSLESLPGTDDPSPRELSDYAVKLAGEADRLVAADPLPGKSEVTRALREVAAPAGMPALAETRLLSLAAAVSGTAVASPRLDLYPRDLDLVRALRISQAAAGARPDRGIKHAALLDRLRAWFPDLAALDPEPTYFDLEEALREAGFQFSYDPKSTEFRPPAPSPQWTSTGTDLLSGPLAPADTVPEHLRRPAHRTAANLARALAEGGFVALTVDQRHLPGTAGLLARTHPVAEVDVTAAFLDQMRALAEENSQPWPGLLRADEKYARTAVIPAGLRSYVSLAWERTTAAITALADAPRKILLLHNAGLLARYHEDGGHRTLVSLQQAARGPESLPYGLWLLCPSEAPKSIPHLDGRTVEAIDASEWSVLDRPYLDTLRKA